MSGTLPANEPECHEAPSSLVELAISARPRDLGGFTVRRVLPSPARRLVGPFIFFDQMGPAEIAPGGGFDVRPHPHIGLATVTYLFDGEIIHRDSVGSHQAIRPGDVNWMIAGRGIMHSERSSDAARKSGLRIHGIQCWVALPLEHETTEPRFAHHPRASIPARERDGVSLNVIAGTAYGLRSPVEVLSPTLYVHALLERGARLELDGEHAQRAVYVVEGACTLGGRTFAAGELAVVRPGWEVVLEAPEPARLMLLGGAELEGARHIDWNFVASTPERIQAARSEYAAGRFPKVTGDEDEFIPLPQ